MALSHRAEEILETLWVQLEETDKAKAEVGLGRNDEALAELAAAGLISREEEEAVALTERGHKEAERAIRRHRLAERLMVDVLDIEEDFCETGCRFEHLLKEGVEESVCTLLGHPVSCPHGKPIPPGPCCKECRRSARKVVSPLSSMEAEEAGRVAYINAGEPGHLQKLMAMGVLPGMALHMLQTFPSFVFQVGQTQYAVDRDLADCIYVRLDNGRAPKRARRRRWGRLPFGGQR